MISYASGFPTGYVSGVQQVPSGYAGQAYFPNEVVKLTGSQGAAPMPASKAKWSSGVNFLGNFWNRS